jgi:NAD+ synthase
MADLTPAVLAIDAEREVERIGSAIKDMLRLRLHRRGLVVAISGGVDSGVCAALCVEALGPNKVFGLLLPERDSSSDSVRLGKQLVDKLGIEHAVENIAPTLEAIGCYRWRDEAIRRIFPEYDGSWPHKLVIRGGLEGRINHFSLVAQTPDGALKEERLALRDYLQVVAATNFKQRIRKTLEYFHADRLNYAVVGTPNRLEYELGFFVKNGDGSADLKPISHLYKTQVYTLARHLDLPEEISNALPTTDTYSLAQGQDEFYFALPYAQMDIALWAHNEGRSAHELAGMLNIDTSRAEQIYQDIVNKRRTTAPLHYAPLLID